MDAVSFSENAYTGSGDALTARNIGYGIKNGVVGNFFVSGLIKQWRPILDNTKLLGVNFEDKGNNNSIESVAENGLAYDQCQGGLKNFSSANTYCSATSMRLPIYGETSANASTFVPSCSGYTWTATCNNIYDCGVYYQRWLNTTITGAGGSVSIASGVRCVK